MALYESHHSISGVLVTAPSRTDVVIFTLDISGPGVVRMKIR